MSYLSKYRLPTAGLLLLLAGMIILMGIITGEVFYPEDLQYTTRNNEISDLGATRPPNSVITQPSATIFNAVMVASGLMIIAALLLLRKTINDWWVWIPFLLLGVGILGVGIFPGNITPWHPLFAMTTFTAGGLAAIMSFRLAGSPLKWLYLSLGVIALVFLFCSQVFIPVLGMGGTERWVAYPIVLWLVSIGSYWLGKEQ
jgi:hypothetical membrane protein